MIGAVMLTEKEAWEYLADNYPEMVATFLCVNLLEMISTYKVITVETSIIMKEKIMTEVDRLYADGLLEKYNSFDFKVGDAKLNEKFRIDFCRARAEEL